MLDNVLKDIKNRELELAQVKAKAKAEAIKAVIELVEGFGITPDEIFKGLAKPAKKPAKGPSPYLAAGFKAGDVLINPKNAAESYVYAKLGKKPLWLGEALKEGKKREDLLKKSEPAKPQTTATPQKPTGATPPKK